MVSKPSPMDHLLRDAPTLEMMREFLEQIQPLMRLQDWAIQIEAQTTKEPYMQIQCTPEYRWATITVCADALNGQSWHDWRQSMIHELTHIYGHPFHKQLNLLLEAVEEPMKRFIEKQQELMFEALVEESATTIWNLLQRSAEDRRDAYDQGYAMGGIERAFEKGLQQKEHLQEYQDGDESGKTAEASGGYCPERGPESAGEGPKEERQVNHGY